MYYMENWLEFSGEIIATFAYENDGRELIL